MFEKLIDFCKNKSKTLLILIAFIVLIIFSVLFYIYSPIIAFNDIYIFNNWLYRIGILFIVWTLFILIFALKPLISLIMLLKDDKKIELKNIKKESLVYLNRAKRNFFISLKDAKSTWKNNFKLKDTPLIILIGNENAGKSTFIHYSNMEYPLNDSLDTHRRKHQSTTNFGLYVSSQGALLDTEGLYFSQEELFRSTGTDELPEDDLEKNKDFMIKRFIWRNFLKFLNKNIFHSKLNGIILIVDVSLFLSGNKEYINNLVSSLVKRINECETFLNIKLPIYIVFTKIDLVDGMTEFFHLLDTDVNNAFGVGINSEITQEYLQKEFQELSQIMFASFIEKSNLISIDEKKNIFLFLKQFDNLFDLVIDFTLKIKKESGYKNKSYIQGIYFVSAYQENVPKNFLFDAICMKNQIKTPILKSNKYKIKKSYFVKSLLEDIIFVNTNGAAAFYNKFIKNITFILVPIIVLLTTYFISDTIIQKYNKEEKMSRITLQDINRLLAVRDYKNYNISEKTSFTMRLKMLLNRYPLLNDTSYPIFNKLSLNMSYLSFQNANNLYYSLNEDILKNTLIKEMENILDVEKNLDEVLIALYVYKSLFDTSTDKELLKIWVTYNYDKLLKQYNIKLEDFIKSINTSNNFAITKTEHNDKYIKLAINKLHKLAKIQRIYTIVNFISLKQSVENLNIKESNIDFNYVFNPKIFKNTIKSIYTKKGLENYIANLDINLNKAKSIEAYVMNEQIINSVQKDLMLDIMKIHLTKYQAEWLRVLDSINPKNNNILDQLSILSKKQNPIYEIIKNVDYNTTLNDEEFLMKIYALGLNATDIKNIFFNTTDMFSQYHKLLDAENKTLENINKDIENLHNKIIDFNNNTHTVGDKLKYITNKPTNSEDPFIQLKEHIKFLPIELERYYSKLHDLSWNLVEENIVNLLNDAWHNEVYSVFISDIAPYYPFNFNSSDDLSIDTFKSFFGYNGTLDNFYKRYLQTIVIRKKHNYYIHPQFQKKIQITKQFMSLMYTASILRSYMFDANNNFKINFTIQSLDLSSQFSRVNFDYDDYSMKYDHTVKNTIPIVTGKFSSGTELIVNAYPYVASQSIKEYQRIFRGEWGWLRLFTESMNENNTNKYTIIFKNDKNLYFDFMVTVNSLTLKSIIKSLRASRVEQTIFEKPSKGK